MALAADRWPSLRERDGCSASEASSQSTELLIADQPATFEPLNASLYGRPSLDELIRSMWAPGRKLPFAQHDVDAASVWHNSSAAGWARASRGPDGVDVVVLGSSVTGGCGNTLGCRIDLSWGRLLQHYLDQQRRASDTCGNGATDRVPMPPRVRVNLRANNAVRGDYYTKCTSSKVSPGPGLVLLEVAANLWGGGGNVLRSATDIVRAVRRAAPEKAVAFALWPAQPKMDETVKAIRQAALTTGADVLDMSQVLKRVTSEAKRLRLRLAIPDFYAKNGKDNAHPTEVGHALFALATARFVTNGLQRRGEDAMGGDGRSAERSGSLPEATPRRSSELCFERADRLPVAWRSESSSWQLVDEGKTGVRKLGLLSSRPGESMALGPLPRLAIHGPSACSLVRVELGYLCSSYVPLSGQFRISCTGCVCSRVAHPWQTLLYPFPLIETDAQRTYNRDVRDVNASVTITTSFNALVQVSQPCFVNITNVPTGTGTLRQHGRVRIDSLTVQDSTSVVALAYMFQRGKDPPLRDASRRTPEQLVELASRCMPEVRATCSEGGGNSTGAHAGWAAKAILEMCAALKAKGLLRPRGARCDANGT